MNEGRSGPTRCPAFDRRAFLRGAAVGGLGSRRGGRHRGNHRPEEGVRRDHTGCRDGIEGICDGRVTGVTPVGHSRSGREWRLWAGYSWDHNRGMAGGN